MESIDIIDNLIGLYTTKSEAEDAILELELLKSKIEDELDK
ncbi:hypothetical protein N6H18_09860 [Reichenbachiella agarivorans]|uniref:Uncharacterized protein n=2 Tax=Reichenbachiella TaxID=156993 RepID=A0A1M6WP87_REIAG|nr:hypothetical protein [Reichenbachiella agarivorans]UXP30659.1 hypothetical protein N6H18_09860 [Reichenbachiella agarivorans]SHK95424.1 hypothetical protein SAMN04488028_1147 [Reichenbachiella agariperforans]